MRHIVLVGKVYRNRNAMIATKCAWCGAWCSRADFIAAYQHHAKVNHGMCRRCSAKMLADASGGSTRPAA